MTCTTHHDACECREAAHKTEIEAKDKRIAELEAEKPERERHAIATWTSGRKFDGELETDDSPHEGWYPLFAASGTQPSVDVDWLANVIRDADGQNTLGAGALAERIAEAMRGKPND